jgi:hypothetical protein
MKTLLLHDRKPNVPALIAQLKGVANTHNLRVLHARPGAPTGPYMVTLWRRPGAGSDQPIFLLKGRSGI